MNHLLPPALLLLSLLSAHAAIEATPLVECLCESGSAPQQAFQLTAEGSAGPFIAFQWAGPNGYSSEEQNPTDITAAGGYTVEATNSFGCAFRKNTQKSPQKFVHLQILPFLDIVQTQRSTNKL